MTYLLALDQGTSSSRAILFTPEGAIVAQAQQEIAQHFPQPGWVEHDPEQLWHTQLATARAVLAQAGVAAREVAALGITNQRETTLVWERATGRPIDRAIVWQDRRTEDLCRQLAQQGHKQAIQDKTGLILDPYFSGTKLRSILDHIPGAQARAERGELAFGTVDTWLAWKLSGGRLHVTDASNAARTMLFNIHTGDWDDELLVLLNIPRTLLPTVHPSSHLYGETDAALFGAAIKIAALAGDQQAALFGQGCFEPGMAKNTYGTGCFLLMNTGENCARSQHGLISTRICQGAGPAQYALEGSVFIGGAVVQWMRDGLKAFERATDVEALAQTVPDAGGVVFVPSFTGLGAPYWNANARGAILGLSRGTTVAHIARAALESIAYQSAALLQAMIADTGTPITELRVDGGASKSTMLLQFQADLLGIPVLRAAVTESTALGAAWLAGLPVGRLRDPAELGARWQQDGRFEPTITRAAALEKMARWENAVRCVDPFRG